MVVKRKTNGEKGTKKTFSVNMEKGLIEWVEKKVTEKVFRDRNHGIEFCVALIKRLPDEMLLRMIFSPDKYPIFLSNPDRERLTNIMTENGLGSIEEAIQFSLRKMKP